MSNSNQLQRDWLFHLNAFLSKCDSNYIAGRALWKLWSYHTAGNLLWLGIEQLAKIIITQTEIENNNLIRAEELKQLIIKIIIPNSFVKSYQIFSRELIEVIVLTV